MKKNQTTSLTSALKSADSQQNRTTLKNNRLEYAYKASTDLGRLPMLGSLVRALSKGWQICVITSDEEMAVFTSFQNILSRSTMKVIRQQDIKQANFAGYDLILIHGLEQKLINLVRNHPQILGRAHVMAVDTKPDDSYDLISDFTQTQVNPMGVTAITGTGKGKTTSALGKAATVLAQGGKAAVFQWFKERKISGDLTWAINEHQFPALLTHQKNIEFFPTGLGFFGSPNMDRVAGEAAYLKHRKKAYEGLELATQALQNRQYDVIILDELVDTVQEIAQNIKYPLIDLADLQKFLQLCATVATPVTVTGRRVSDEWSRWIGRSIVVSEIKHPWSSAQKGAISGLDF